MRKLFLFLFVIVVYGATARGWQEVTITVYNPTRTQCDDTPLITASNKRIDPKRINALMWCAVSRDLLEEYSYGDTINVFISDGHSLNGRYVIQDTMNKRFTNRIDLLSKLSRGKWSGKIK